MLPARADNKQLITHHQSKGLGLQLSPPILTLKPWDVCNREHGSTSAYSDVDMNVHASMQSALRGIGLAGARVILACRDMAKGEQAARDIIREVKGAKVVAKLLDLADTKSICQFAENIYNSGWCIYKYTRTHKHTDFHEDCSAVTMRCVFQLRRPFTTWSTMQAWLFALMPSQRMDSRCSLESITWVGDRSVKNTSKALFPDFSITFSSALSGHFFLTYLLLDLLKHSAPSRVINLSSAAHSMGKIQFDDLSGEKNYHPVRAYAQSKLANVLFTRELAKRTEGRVCVLRLRSYIVHCTVRLSLCLSLSLSVPRCPFPWVEKIDLQLFASVRVSCPNHNCSEQRERERKRLILKTFWNRYSCKGNLFPSSVLN